MKFKWIFGLGWMILILSFVYVVAVGGFRPLYKIGENKATRIDRDISIDIDSAGWDQSSSIYYSVKTTPAFYKNRLDVLRATWFQLVDRDKLSIVSDYLNDSFHEEKLFEAELIKEKFKLVLADCIIRHERVALCCKSGTEYNQFYDYVKNHRDGQNQPQIKWYCHFDDDIYVNVKELSKLLAKYNSSKPYYIGRNPRGPRGVKVNQYLKTKFHIKNYLYAAGAAYCNSLALMKELYKYFRNSKSFKHTCERMERSDDITTGAIVGMVLNHGLTNIESMHSQAVSLKHLSTTNLTKMITLSYQTDRENQQKIISNIDPKPRRFTILEDPTRFLTYHCLLYNETSWCQLDSPGPPMLMKYNLTNSVHSQASDHSISQPSKAPSGQDNSNKNLPNNQAYLRSQKTVYRQAHLKSDETHSLGLHIQNQHLQDSEVAHHRD